MIMFVIIAFVIVGLLSYWIFGLVTTAFRHLEHKIKTGGGDEKATEARHQLMWARMLLIKSIMFCVIGTMFAIAIGVAP